MSYLHTLSLMNRRSVVFSALESAGITQCIMRHGARALPDNFIGAAPWGSIRPEVYVQAVTVCMIISTINCCRQRRHAIIIDARKVLNMSRMARTCVRPVTALP